MRRGRSRPAPAASTVASAAGGSPSGAASAACASGAGGSPSGAASAACASGAGRPARLVLLRHGATGTEHLCVGRRVDPALSAEGLAQTLRAVHRLGLRPDRVVTSPLRRARQTAARWGLPVTVDERLAERDFGAWEGRPWAQLWTDVAAEVLADAAAYARFTPPGGESLEAVVARVAAAVADLSATPGQVTLAVTHAGPLRLAIAGTLGLAPEQGFGFAAGHARAAVLDRHGDGWSLHRLGA